MKVRLYTSSLNGDRAVRAVERAGCLSGTEDISCVTKGEGRLAIVGNMADKDEEAPIFGVADLGIVGDVHKVLPELISALESRG